MIDWKSNYDELANLLMDLQDCYVEDLSKGCRFRKTADGKKVFPEQIEGMSGWYYPPEIKGNEYGEEYFVYEIPQSWFDRHAAILNKITDMQRKEYEAKETYRKKFIEENGAK